jgi:hypothetical protein
VVYIAGSEITRYKEISPKPRTKDITKYWMRRLQDPSFLEDVLFEIIRNPSFLAILPASVVLYLAYDHLELILVALSDCLNMVTGAGKGLTSLTMALGQGIKKPISGAGKLLFGK